MNISGWLGASNEIIDRQLGGAWTRPSQRHFPLPFAVNLFVLSLLMVYFIAQHVAVWSKRMQRG